MPACAGLDTNADLRHLYTGEASWKQKSNRIIIIDYLLNKAPV